MRKLRPTGYWFFSASPGIWDVDRWAQEEEDRLLYYVGEDDRSMIQVGDLGLIKRNVWRYRKSAIMAIVEVVEPVGVRPETDIRFFVDPDEGAQPDHRVALEVLAIPAPPIQISFLPNTAEYKYLHKGLQRTTTPISRAVFEHVAALAGISGEDVRAARGARSRAGVRQLERSADDLTPKARSRTSKVIERGPIGARVKAARKNCCQVCEALGRHPIAFQKRHGGGFSEAHHVMPVAHLIRGSLGAENIMVLCPNHHRQAHHGRFEIVNDDGLVWTVEIDGKKFKIERTIL